MRIELEQYLDRVYRMADSIGEGSSSVNEGLSSSTRSVFDALKPKLCLISRGRGVLTVMHRLTISIGPVVKDQVNQRTSLLHSERIS